MGMYTEFYLRVEFKKSVSPKVLHFLNNYESPFVQFAHNYNFEHKFFTLPRWKLLLNTVENVNGLIYDCKGELKNYDNEIEEFLDFIEPYCVAYEAIHIYEGHVYPTIELYNCGGGD